MFAARVPWVPGSIVAIHSEWREMVLDTIIMGTDWCVHAGSVSTGSLPTSYTYTTTSTGADGEPSITSCSFINNKGGCQVTISISSVPTVAGCTVPCDGLEILHRVHFKNRNCQALIYTSPWALPGEWDSSAGAAICW